jgi:ABC-type uncharacterized transport system substrate-binding protein
MKAAAILLAGALGLVPAVASAHPHLWISQSVRVVSANGAYTGIEIDWRFDPHSSEDEIPAIDEDNDGKISDEEVALLVRDTMASLQKFGFQTWLNTGAADFQPSRADSFVARIEDPATFTPPDWDRTAGDGMKMPDNKRATLPAEHEPHRDRNLVYTFRFALPQPVKSFSITTYDPEDVMRFEVDQASLPAGCTLAKHPTFKSEFIPGQPVFADRVTCRLP